MTSATLPREIEDTLDELTEEVRRSAGTMGAREARYLVDTYYEMQEHRKRTWNQMRALSEANELPVLADWIEKQAMRLEGRMKGFLQAFAEGQVPGRWALSQVGVGPVITGGLLAHIDIAKAPTVGHIWRFAGLDPTQTWGKGEKRPYNAKLKVLCWKIGDSFVKQSGRPGCIYGHIYRERKALEVERNERGDFADQAATSLATKRFGDNDTRKRYEAGQLPDGRIDLRARRYAVKLFLSHLHHVMYEVADGEPPPKPYILTRPEHAHFLAPPNWPMAS